LGVPSHNGERREAFHRNDRRPTVDDSIKFFIGLDVHKDSIAIAAAPANSRDEPRFIGTTGYNVAQVMKALSRSQCTPAQLAIAYEAGPCGYGLARELLARGYPCVVVAPSRVARRPADRIKTDRRDALLLARLHRSAELVAVTIPEPADEAVRDLLRARDDAVKAQRCARQQLMALLLRMGNPYREGRGWTQKFLRFLADIRFDDPHHRIVFTEYRLAVQTASERVVRLEVAIRNAAESWRWHPVVKALMSLRSVDFLTAMTIVAEVGDLRRFEHPRQLMSYLGLVPSEFSSGNSHCRGALTRTGNTRVRRVLIEAAWNYRHPPKISREIETRQAGVPADVIEIAWKAQVRLCHRYRKLRYRGLHQNKTCAAIARELVGFVWDIGRHVRPSNPIELSAP
jgi:transposase